MTPPEKVAQRLRMIQRTVALLRWAIERNGGIYLGSLTPNLQSVTDLTDPETTPDATLDRWERSIVQLELGRPL